MRLPKHKSYSLSGMIRDCGGLVPCLPYSGSWKSDRWGSTRDVHTENSLALSYLTSCSEKGKLYHRLFSSKC